MSEESNKNIIYLMIDMDDECVFKYTLKDAEKEIQEKPNAIAAYADIDELNNGNYKRSDKRKNISIPENGIIEIARNDLKENNFYFVLKSEHRIANFNNMTHVQFGPNKNFYYMKFNDVTEPIHFEDNSIIKEFDREGELTVFKQQQNKEQNEQQQVAPVPQSEQSTEQTEQPAAEPASQTEPVEQPPEQPAEQPPEQPAEQPPEQPAEQQQQNESTKQNEVQSEQTNNKSSKSKWLFMIAGGLLVAAGIAMSFLTFGFGIIPFGTAAAALSVAIPSALGTALVTGASIQFAKRKMSKIAIAAIALGAAITLSAILLSVFTFGLGVGAVALAGTVVAGLAIGIPVALGASSIIAASIYVCLTKTPEGYTELSDFSKQKNKSNTEQDSPNSELGNNQQSI